MSDCLEREEAYHGDTEARRGWKWCQAWRVGEEILQWGRHSCLPGGTARRMNEAGIERRLIGGTDRNVCPTVSWPSPPSAPCLCASVVTFLLLTLITGCSPTKPVTSAKPAMTHEEEHGIPPHKPHNFAKAVSEVQQRGHELLNSNTRSEVAVAEWFDIIGWLLELAADTDLVRADWDKVARVSTQLESWSTAWKSSADNKAQPAADQFEPLLSELQTILNQLPPEQRSITPRSHPHFHADSEEHSND